VYERILDLQRRRRELDHPEVATTLRRLAQLHLSRGNVAAAEVRFRQALDIRRSCLGDKHPDTAESLNDLAWLLYQAGNLIHAEGLFQSTLEVRRECLGATHPDTLASQHGLALVALAKGAPAEAAQLMEQALARIGDDHPEKLPLMHTLARACHAQGNWARGLTLLLDILLAQEKIVGENHMALGPVLADLAQVHAGLGDHLAARELLERIRSIRAASPFPDPIAQALNLVSLSDSHRLLHDPGRADDLARQALDIARRHLKRGDPGLVGYLSHRARTCLARRALSAARRYLHEALGLVRKEGGDRHPLLAGLWMDLADLEVSRRKPHRATPLYTQAAELLQKVLGEDHPDHAAARRMLGLHLQTLGAFAPAEEALSRHLNIVRRTAGPEHPAVAVAHQALSELQRQRGDLTAATSSCRQALDLIRQSVPPLDAVHANLLHLLAVLCRQQGQLEEAAKLLGHTVEIDRTATGEEGMGHLESVFELALIEAARGQDASALKRLHRVLSLQDQLTAACAYLPPSPPRDALLVAPWRILESFLTVALRLPDAAEQALAGVVRWKGLGPTDLVPGDRMALRRRHPAHAQELDRLFDLSAQIAGRLVKGAGPEGLQMHHDLLRRWEEERQGLEGQLAEVVPDLAKLRALRAVDLPSLRRALPAGATFVEVVRFHPRDFAEMCAGRDGLRPLRYLGFVLPAEEQTVVMCDLGSAVDLEGGGGPEMLRAVVGPHLAGRGRLLVATDGGLARAAWVRLRGSRASVRTLTSGREIVSPLLARQGGWLAWLRG
jgi:tetratricopeptide (TPR) repeat protein